MAGTGSSKAVDPIAYRPEEQGNIADSKVTETTQNWTFDPRKLENADVNISAYGDDSSEKNYNNPELWGGENEKYKGENTKNTSVAYNPDATLEGLNPNYAYGQKAQMVNSGEAGYIQRRNDEIASALYNAGKVSPEDVRAYLEQQEGFMNSTANERENTIKSVWKRLGEISSSQSKNENKTDGNAEGDNNALKNMENDLNKDRSGTLYGKNTADINGEDSAIKTLADANSVEARINQSRINNFKSLQAMDSEKVAVMLSEGMSVYGEQAMRDLMQYDPQKYQEIQDKVKEIKGQNMIEQISINGKINVTDQLDKDVDTVNNDMNSFVEKTASERDAASLSQNLSNALSESEVVSTARGQMEEYKRKTIEIQQAIDDLPALAKQYFKSDVPQYMVNAFISNRMQQYNKELKKYQDLFSATLDEAKTEIAQSQWREEMDYKWKSLRADQEYKDANIQLQREKMMYDVSSDAMSNKINLIKSGKWNSDGSFSYIDANGNMVVLDKTNAMSQTNEMLSSNADSFFAIWQSKMDNAKQVGDACYGGQCESFTDNYTNQYYGVTMTGDGHARTTAEEKAGYANVFTPYKGTVAIWNYEEGTENMKKYGHTAVVMDFDPVTGDFTFMESNGDGNGTVGIRQSNIYTDGNLQGFRDPTKPSLKEQQENAEYEYFNTPMHSLFVDAYESAKTKDLKDDINRAEDSYAILYDLYTNGYIDHLIESDDAAVLLAKIGDGKFVDNSGNIAFNLIEEYARNELKDEKVAYAVDRLHRLIEKKLRKESGAAINISEWNGNFDMYLPQVGQSKEYRRDRLIALEKDVVAGQLPSTHRTKYQPIIPSNDAKKEEKETELQEAKDIIKDALKKQNEGK